MVPSSRLLIWMIVLGLPLFLLAGMDSPWSNLWMAAIGCFSLILILDSVFSLGRLDGLGVETGKIQRLLQDQEGSLEIFITNASKKARQIRLGWAFPRNVE